MCVGFDLCVACSCVVCQAVFRCLLHGFISVCFCCLFVCLFVSLFVCLVLVVYFFSLSFYFCRFACLLHDFQFFVCLFVCLSFVCLFSVLSPPRLLSATSFGRSGGVPWWVLFGWLVVWLVGWLVG